MTSKKDSPKEEAKTKPSPSVSYREKSTVDLSRINFVVNPSLKPELYLSHRR